MQYLSWLFYNWRWKSGCDCGDSSKISVQKNNTAWSRFFLHIHRVSSINSPLNYYNDTLPGWYRWYKSHERCQYACRKHFSHRFNICNTDVFASNHILIFAMHSLYGIQLMETESFSSVISHSTKWNEFKSCVFHGIVACSIRNTYVTNSEICLLTTSLASIYLWFLTVDTLKFICRLYVSP